MLSNIKDDGDHVILNGSKMWISNAPFAQVAVVWAKDEQGEIRGLVVERGMEGFSTPTTHGKWSLRASATGELVFDNVKVPKTNLFLDIRGLKGPLSCLTKARFGIAWGSVGAAMDCYDTALAIQQGKDPVWQAHWWVPASAEKTGRNDYRNNQGAIDELAVGRIDE